MFDPFPLLTEWNKEFVVCCVKDGKQTQTPTIKTIESDLERERSISLNADINEKRISKEKKELLRTENE